MWQLPSCKRLAALAAILFAAAGKANPPCVPGTIDKGDFDERGDVSLVDFEVFQDCFAGPYNIPDYEPALCLAALDFDEDGDVDLHDWGGFQAAFTGECVGLGACPEGTHLVHASGATGLDGGGETFDDASFSPTDYECVADTTCDGVDCGAHGTCTELNGQAVCACDRGYAGDGCSECDFGYEIPVGGGGECVLGQTCRDQLCSGQGNCVDTGLDIVCQCDADASGEFCQFGGPAGFKPPTRVRISGTDTHVERGETRIITADLIGDGDIDTELRWTLIGSGSLEPTTGPIVVYTAPDPDPNGSPLTINPAIQVCSAAFPDHCATRYLSITPPNAIPVSGQTNALFKPLDDMIVAFMKARCVGAAVVGVSVFGKPVYLRGYGNLSGAPTNDSEYCESCDDMFNVSNLHGGFPLPEPSPVKPNTPFRIGSNSKAITAALTRKAIKEYVLEDPTASDDLVEASVLCFESLNLLPPAVRAVLCEGAAPPIPLPDEDTIDDDPVACADLTESADSRWSQVTIGDLLGHRSGMPRSVPDIFSVLYPNLGVLRGLDSTNDWDFEESQFEDDNGFPSGTFGNEFPNYNYNSSRYYVGRVTGWEAIRARAGGCLAFDPGEEPPATDDNGDPFNSYSNTAFSFLGNIASWVSLDDFGGTVGKPDQHDGSLLDQFLTGDLGFPYAGQQTDEGIFYSQDVWRVRHTEEPVYRDWSSGDGHYYPLAADGKRPFCVWDEDAEACLFDDFINTTRLDWDFFNEETLTAYKGGEFDSVAAAGSHAAEAEAYLRFMARYWVGGSGQDPRYGETRCPNGKCVWTMFTGHNGARTGTYSAVRQLGGAVNSGEDCDLSGGCDGYLACAGKDGQHWRDMFCLGGGCFQYNEYTIPPIDHCTGLPGEEFWDPQCHTCRAPVGVDFFIAVNQWDDKKCRDSEAKGEDDPEYYKCTDAYDMLIGYVYHALCKIDFPPNPYVFWPPLPLSGETGFSPPFESGIAALTGQANGDPLAAGGGDSCCGNGVKEPGEECDGTDFGGTSCGSFGFEMGDLTCTPACFADTSACSGGIPYDPPGSYDDCGYDGEDCDNSPGGCGADGNCLGGPCAVTNPGDWAAAIDDPFNTYAEFHPDGNFRDQDGNLYYCPDDTQGANVCVNVNNWGVCKRCSNDGGELSTLIGCPCDEDVDCEGAEPNLTCWGEEFPGATGFCWDEQEGPPEWQCPEGTCGMSPGYINDESYCEHYAIDGDAECQPWDACNALLARVCAGENKVCDEFAAPGCDTSDCCATACQTDEDCSPEFGWPPGYTCENTPEDLQCVP